MTQNSWKILVTKVKDNVMHCYTFQKSDTKQAKFPSLGNLPIYMGGNLQEGKYAQTVSTYRQISWSFGVKFIHQKAETKTSS